ncbi:MAG: hypothetical protein J3R72DRAFT_458486 [Linnemannia gamsii]|nr:MAG: hypothetical protein J3R72DRAFT_466229 [Linnemannia gamsii]KAK3815996.1 MAG: hypothetical protein J3R72DRAFT_461237 [Linnemannia gamsii]KAK3824281.1 MAG: hypothetical protein J3R72DRAFT_458481 [Linnemannia gamsii]KAK3824282.1 MAG: hypothetical protein J3R72DRAFT_458486 [Linnemannia gamsii]
MGCRGGFDHSVRQSLSRGCLEVRKCFCHDRFVEGHIVEYRVAMRARALWLGVIRRPTAETEGVTSPREHSVVSREMLHTRQHQISGGCLRDVQDKFHASHNRVSVFKVHELEVNNVTFVLEQFLEFALTIFNGIVRQEICSDPQAMAWGVEGLKGRNNIVVHHQRSVHGLLEVLDGPKANMVVICFPFDERNHLGKGDCNLVQEILMRDLSDALGDDQEVTLLDLGESNGVRGVLFHADSAFRDLADIVVGGFRMASAFGNHGGK